VPTVPLPAKERPAELVSAGRFIPTWSFFGRPYFSRVILIVYVSPLRLVMESNYMPLFKP